MRVYECKIFGPLMYLKGQGPQRAKKCAWSEVSPPVRSKRAKPTAWDRIGKDES
jgi:hypothetical protein